MHSEIKDSRSERWEEGERRQTAGLGCLEGRKEIANERLGAGGKRLTGIIDLGRGG